MKQLTWKFVLSITLISFTLVTQWWYVLPVDAPDTMMSGFPLPYVCEGWHTSLSLQIFVLELLFDISVYFLFWYALTLGIDRWVVKIGVHRYLYWFLCVVAGLCACGFLLIGSNPNNIYHFKRPYGIEVLMTGPEFIWQGNLRPQNFDFEGYERKKHIPQHPRYLQ